MTAEQARRGGSAEPPATKRAPGPREDRTEVVEAGGREAALWIGAYLLAVLAPLAVAVLVDSPPGRGFWTEFSSGLGFAGLSMMMLQFVITSRFRRVAAPYGIDIVLQFHRQVSFLAGGLLLAHVLILFITRPETIQLLNVFEAPWRARFAVISMIGFAILLGTSVWRKELRIRYEPWRLSHAALAVLVLAFGLAHVIGVGHYLELAWKQGLWILLTGAAIGALVYIRIGKPIWLLHESYEIQQIREERGNAWTVRLRPVGHPGFRFTPGQFGWLTLVHSPFSIREHPFSFSSSAEDHEGIEVTIKNLGDFTGEVGRVPEGQRAYLDGPHGVFTPERHEAPGYVFIAGGIGITPVMSILRTFADRGDRRPLQLIYAVGSLDDMTFREEIEALRDRLNLDLVEVPRKPPEGWEGETGYVDRDLLDRVLPEDRRRRFYFICGPQPLMEGAEDALLSLGIPLNRTVMERFNLV
jgi:predicted ferric reductase